MKYKKLIFIFSVLIISSVLFVNLLPALADTSNNQTEEQPEGDAFTQIFFTGAGFNWLESAKGQDVRLYVVALIKMALSFTGFLFFILMVYAGLRWLTAAGNEETATKAKQIISKAVVGFAIVLAAYGITAFIGYYIGRSIMPGGQQNTNNSSNSSGIPFFLEENDKGGWKSAN